MDKKNRLLIRKRPSLTRRFPQVISTHPLERKKAGWVVFSQRLTPDLFDDINFFTGIKHKILDVWKVGQYEVALMNGEITEQHEEILQALKLDYARLSELPDLTKPGLIVLDMDSTAITIECIDEVAKLAGVGEEVEQITERAMQGELDFEQSLRSRVALLKGADEAILEEVRYQLTFTPDLIELINTLKTYGWKTAIASGGFTYFSDYLQEKLKLDNAISNHLEVIEGKLTGNIVGSVVSAQTKADILHQLAEHYDIELHNTIAVGDGANDLLMMDNAGLGVAYHAKPKVEKAAQSALRNSALGGVLCILSAGLAQKNRLSHT
jgi:phosphoserine phosphatase